MKIIVRRQLVIDGVEYLVFVVLWDGYLEIKAGNAILRFVFFNSTFRFAKQNMGDHPFDFNCFVSFHSSLTFTLQLHPVFSFIVNNNNNRKH